jgi:multiple sugar transport system permease protein
MAISMTAPAVTGAGPVTLARQEQRFAVALLAPALLLLLLTTTIPLVYLAWNSLQRIDLGMPWLSGFAGLGNYAKMGSDPRFWSSLWLTAVYTASTVALQVVIGLSLALLVLQIPKGQGVLRIAAILPIVLAPVVVGLFWRTLVLAPDFGLVDLVTRSAGLASNNWLGDPQLALISVIAIHTWQWTPFAFLVMLATLATLPPDVYEAARLDRARPWQRFIYITLPLIRPAIVMVVIMRTMTALSAFAAIFAATGGGPGSSTEILNLYASSMSGMARRWRWC